MNTRKFALNEDQKAELRRQYDSGEDGRTQQRLQAVRLYGEGWSSSDIQDMVGCSERSLLRWCERYRQQGINSLASGWRGGNHATLSLDQRAEAIAKLQAYQPDQILPADVRVSRGTFWTVSDARIGLQRWYGIAWRSDNSYRTLLAQAGLSLQRTENTYRSRPTDQTIADFEARLEKK